MLAPLAALADVTAVGVGVLTIRWRRQRQGAPVSVCAPAIRELRAVMRQS